MAGKYHETDTPGVYILPEELRQTFRITSSTTKEPKNLYTWMTPNFDATNRDLVDVGLGDGGEVQLLGLYINPIRLRNDLTVEWCWGGQFRPTKIEIKIPEASHTPIQNGNERIRDDTILFTDPHGWAAGRMRAVEEEDQGEPEEASVDQEEPEVTDEIFVYGRWHRHHYSRLKVSSNSRLIEWHPDDTNGHQNHHIKRFHFGDDSWFQMYRFKKGWTLRFINCGISRRLNKTSVRSTIEDIEVHCLYPEDGEFKHEEYTGAEAKPFPVLAEQKDRDKAEHNASVWGDLMESLQEIAGEYRFNLLDAKKDPPVDTQN